jgi:ATP-binding cassette subfamily F protein 2
MLSPRTVAGSLASHPLSRDVQVQEFSLQFHGRELVVDSMLELNYGRRYGLIGLNGTGKSTLLQAIVAREVPVPGHIDIHLLAKEIEGSDQTALEAVMADVTLERERLEEQAERLAEEDEPDSNTLEDIYDRLEALDGDLAEKNAGEILFGLGFDKDMQAKKTRDFSGGWRMRIALSKVLFTQPTCLLLDEPTNHLDLDACVWLEEYLKTWTRTLVIVSHSQDFLNGVCTNIILLRHQKLQYFTGNYDSYVKTRRELEENQSKRYKKEQEEIAHMKDFIARFGHGTAKLARQAQSREKLMAKMIENGLTEKVVSDHTLKFELTNVGKMVPPVIMFDSVSFCYPGTTKMLYTDLSLSIDLESRVALVGPNGCGKSTLLKLMTGELSATMGAIRQNSHLRVCRYHQHLADHIDINLTPLEYMIQQFPDVKDEEKTRSAIGRFGLSGKEQMTPIGKLSDGQQARVVFAWLTAKTPHLLLLDEPTNHLDMETIDSLADAINKWDGGMILVSHDFRLISQVAKEIWLCENGNVNELEGDISAYKEHLRKQMLKARETNTGK